MSTVAQARAALVTAVGATDGPISPPCSIVLSNGSDLTILGGTNTEWGFRVRVYAGFYSDDAAMEDKLAVLVQTTLVILRALAGFKIVSVSPSLIDTTDGGRTLAADIAVTTPVALS